MKIEDFINENLLLGRALIDLEVSNKGSNPLWTGFVATNKGEIPAYIKKCKNTDGLCIEIISSLIGLLFGIPIPKPIIVLVEPNHPQIAVQKPTYLFGSLKYDMPSFERFLRDSELTEECLLEYDGLSKILTFDEFIANPDRNKSNILYDGDKFRFIDHEKAFDPNQDPRSPINDQIKIDNISDIVQHYKGEQDVYIHTLMKKIKKIIKEDLSTSNYDALITTSKNNLILSPYNTILDRVRSFLIARHNHLEVLIENAITPPRQTDQLDLIGG